jgi:maltose alpha-D-glucosyltransferase/alpha-amylase
LADRRAKHSPLRDVAGMLRSFHYAACMGLAAAGSVVAERWCDAVSAAFLRGYRATAPKSVLPKNERDFRLLLDVYLLEKALYELRYEMNNRPDWVHVPLAGLMRAMGEKP